MGLLGKKFDTEAAILGFFGVPPKVLQERKEAKAEAEGVRRLHEVIDADPNLSPQDKEYAKRFPKAYIENYMSRFQTRQFGAGGGSIAIPGAGGQAQFQMAPSRHEFQGSVMDVSGDGAVTPRHQGTQWITPQPGTTAFGVNSFTGRRRSVGDAPQPMSEDPSPFTSPQPGPALFQPGQVVGGYRFKGGDDTDPNNWEPVGGGGTGRTGPSTFPGVPF